MACNMRHLVLKLIQVFLLLLKLFFYLIIQSTPDNSNLPEGEIEKGSSYHLEVRVIEGKII